MGGWDLYIRVGRVLGVGNVCLGFGHGGLFEVCLFEEL